MYTQKGEKPFLLDQTGSQIECPLPHFHNSREFRAAVQTIKALTGLETVDIPFEFSEGSGNYLDHTLRVKFVEKSPSQR